MSDRHAAGAERVAMLVRLVPAHCNAAIGAIARLFARGYGGAAASHEVPVAEPPWKPALV